MPFKKKDPQYTEKYQAPALSKGLDILEYLAGTNDGRTQAQIAEALGRSRSEIFRILVVLRRRGYVHTDETSEQYILTTRLFEISHRHPPIRHLTNHASEALHKLATRIGQSVHMTILHSRSVLVIAQSESGEAFVTATRLGAIFPLYRTASGRVLAAWLSYDSVQKLTSDAEPSEKDFRKDFLKDLPNVRSAGVAKHASPDIVGVTCVAVPVFGSDNHVIAAIAVPFNPLLSRTRQITIDAVERELRSVSTEISARLKKGGS